MSFNANRRRSLNRSCSCFGIFSSIFSFPVSHFPLPASKRASPPLPSSFSPTFVRRYVYIVTVYSPSIPREKGRAVYRGSKFSPLLQVEHTWALSKGNFSLCNAQIRDPQYFIHKLRLTIRIYDELLLKNMCVQLSCVSTCVTSPSIIHAYPLSPPPFSCGYLPPLLVYGDGMVFLAATEKGKK